MQRPHREAAHRSPLTQKLHTEAAAHRNRRQRPHTKVAGTQSCPKDRGHRTRSSPVLGGNCDGCDVAVPVGAGALCLAQDVAHAALARPLCHEAVLWPVGQVVQVEGKVVLQCRGHMTSQGTLCCRQTGP